MQDKDNLLIEAYKVQIGRFNKRRDIEWRFTLTFWSGVVVITLGLAGKIQLPIWTSIVYGLAMLSFGFAAYGRLTTETKGRPIVIGKVNTRDEHGELVPQRVIFDKRRRAWKPSP